MSKLSCVISCPLDTYSGYGKRSVDFVKELIKVSDWDIKILSQRWGSCRMGYLEDHGEQDLIDRIVPNISERPDIWIQITVPNEFQAVGTKYNIGITAGVETTLCDYSWIEGCNRMNMVVVSSEVSRASIYNTVYTDNRTGQKFTATSLCRTLFEGIDTERYKSEPKKTEVLADLKNAWNYLVVGHWLQGDFGEDRKNIPLTIKLFLETFKDREKAPGLVLKISRGITSTIDKEDLIARIADIRKSVQYKKSLPNVYLLHGDLTDAEMNEVYNDPRIKAMITLTKGEGFGRPVVEFASLGKPVIASAWSGYTDVLPKDGPFYVGGIMKQVHPSAVQEHVILAESSWFSVDTQVASKAMVDVFENYAVWKHKAEKVAKHVVDNYSLEKMGEVIKAEIVEAVENTISEQPKEPIIITKVS